MRSVVDLDMRRIPAAAVQGLPWADLERLLKAWVRDLRTVVRRLGMARGGRRRRDVEISIRRGSGRRNGRRYSMSIMWRNSPGAVALTTPSWS